MADNTIYFNCLGLISLRIGFMLNKWLNIFGSKTHVLVLVVVGRTLFDRIVLQVKIYSLRSRILDFTLHFQDGVLGVISRRKVLSSGECTPASARCPL